MPRAVEPPDSTSFAFQFSKLFKAWCRQPTQVASICPSSSALMRCLVDRPSLQSADAIVELGPGSGGTTQAILSQIQAETKLLAIEKTDLLIEPLQQIEDPRLSVVHGDALDLKAYLKQNGLEKVDVVISGIPFSTIPRDVSLQIMDSIDSVLRPGGSFIAYQMKDAVAQFATPKFGNPTKQRVLMNFPPLTVYEWTKEGVEPGTTRLVSRPHFESKRKTRPFSSSIK